MQQLRTPWTAQDYAPFIRGEGARKLADSGIAPLVAVARGYRTFENENLKETLSFLGLNGNQAWGRKLKQLTPTGEDVLYLPWFNIQRVIERGIAATASARQVRPSSPETDPATGKTKKYEFLAGQQTVLDAHPSTPVDWFEESPAMLFTEGIPKGDAAITAMLLDSDEVTVEDLAIGNLNEDMARQKLNTLMLSVPRSKWVTVVSFAGVANWRNQSEWRMVNLKGRKAYVAFDGDIRTNRQVWRQASDLWKWLGDNKHATPYLVDLDGATAGMQKLAAKVDSEEKIGLDDYLTRVGDWSDLDTILETDLLQEPMQAARESQTAIGSVRVNEDNTAVEQYKKSSEVEIAMGMPGFRWETLANVGGRVVSVETRRVPTAAEVESGTIDRKIDDEQSETTCEIEISWYDDLTDKVETEVVRGPANLLSIVPREWHKHASVPPRVQAIPAWPPQEGAKWLEAIKAHRREELAMRMAWDVMGWVPVENAHPAFIVGNETLTAPGVDPNAVERGVNDPGSSKFGVIDVYPDCKDADEYYEQVRADIRTVLTAYLEKGVWRNESVAAATVGAMLRPTLPLQPHAVLYLYGPPRSGKTLTAGYIMGGWHSKPGTWSHESLPGQATDTKPAIERDLSRHPIWVADDLPPSVDKRKAENDEAKIGEVIRAVHNGSGRRKMDGAGGVATATPRSVFIITAENEPTVPSVRDRVLLLNTPPREAFGNQQALNELTELNAKDGAPARLTAHMIRFWLNGGSGEGWSERVDALRDVYEKEVLERCFEYLEETHGIQRGEAARHAKMASDLALSFVVLRQLALEAKMDPTDPLLENLYLYGENSYPERVFALAAQGISRQRDSSPGATLVECIAGVLRIGRGHLLNPGDPAQPPFSGENASMMNRFVGWSPDPTGQGTRPMGDMLGYLMQDTATGEYYAVFTPEEAFSAAQRLYPNKILYGQNAKVAWDSVWAENLTTQKRRADGRNPQFRIGQKSSIRAVPVRLDALVMTADEVA